LPIAKAIGLLNIKLLLNGEKLMATATLVVSENDAFLKTDIVQDLIKQLNAIDTYDSYDGWSNARIIDPIVLTKERKREIPVIGDPDELTIARLKAYYNSLATLIEKKTGLMAAPIVNLSHEGFGRALIMVGKLIVVDKILRDTHRFGFASLEDLCEKSDKTLARALELIEKYNNAATD
jgi:probable nitrogen fixation protein